MRFKQFMLRLWLVAIGFLFVGLMAYSAQAQTLHGYNSSRLMDQLTDSEGLTLLPDRVAAIKAIPAAERAVLRWPGGTVSTKYDIDCYGYDCKGSKRYGGKNAVDLFIELCKELGCKVTIVLSVGNYGNFFWEIQETPDAIAKLEAQNRALIERFIKAGVPIFCVEIGNEQYLHIPKGNYRPSNWNYNFLARLLGEPARDARYRQQVDDIYSLYVRAYERNAKLVAEYNLPAAIPMVSNEAHRNLVWNSMIAHIPAKYGVFHHYEKDDRSRWEYNYNLFLEAIRAQKRIPICTEWNSNHGDGGADNLNLAYTSFQREYQKWFRGYSVQQKVPLIMMHRLNGDPNTWIQQPNQRQVQPNIHTPYDWRF